MCERMYVGDGNFRDQNKTGCKYHPLILRGTKSTNLCGPNESCKFLVVLSTSQKLIEKFGNVLRSNYIALEGKTIIDVRCRQSGAKIFKRCVKYRGNVW